jgi:hypothetical protein
MGTRHGAGARAAGAVVVEGGDRVAAPAGGGPVTGAGGLAGAAGRPDGGALDGYLGLIAALGELEPAVCLFGGFAEDALLHGSVSRAHSDVDVLVVREKLADRLEQFRRLGFVDFETYYETVPGRPLVLNGERGGLHLELGIFEVDARGRPFFEVRDSDGVLCRITLAAGALEHPPSRLEGLRVRTLSPLALYQIRAGLHAVAAFGALRPHDVRAQALLKERFFAGRRERDLLPEIARLRE